MKQAFKPEINKLYVFEKYTILLLTSGSGIFQVDFRNYNFTENKAIFLSSGQYFQLLSGSFSISKLEFPNETIQQHKNSRYLFKHLVSIGHIDYDIPKQFHLNQLPTLELTENNLAVLSNSIQEWINLNPFNTNEENINLLFDLKDIIDQNFKESIDLNFVSKKLNEKPYRLNLLTKEKLSSTFNKLTTDKILLEAKRKIVFTNLSTKEIAYENGFKDPTYFNRFFKQHTNATPFEFREKYEFDERDTFIKDLSLLIDDNFKEQHHVEFYANILNMTVKSVSSKVQNKLDISLKELIIQKLLLEAKKMVSQGMLINEISFELGFKEPNHFTAFFKKNTGHTPSQYSSPF